MENTSRLTVEITASTKQFEAAIKQATLTVQEFKRVLRTIPWWCRAWLFITSIIHGLPTVPDIAELPATRPTHVPLLVMDGVAIQGIKRCQDCGLSETYWARWPQCDTKGGN